MRPELNVETCLEQSLHHVRHRARARVAVRLWHIVVDDQNAGLLARSVSCDEYGFAVGKLKTFEFGTPTVKKLPQVSHLVGLDTGVGIPAMRNAFLVNNLRPWLINNFMTGLPHLEREIGVFTIGWRIALVESAQRGKELAADQE